MVGVVGVVGVVWVVVAVRGMGVGMAGVSSVEGRGDGEARRGEAMYGEA